MLGVILWSDASVRKAVIWCEDQGDLAFLNSSDDLVQSDEFFDAGDLVQFEMEVQSSMRRAHNLRLVVEHAGDNLPDALKQRRVTRPVKTDENVIPFTALDNRAVRSGRPLTKASGG